MIKVRCYSEDEFFVTKKDAIAFYEEAAINSEGNEQRRYLNILGDLDSDKKEISDYDGDDVGYDFDEVLDNHDLYVMER